MPFIETEEVYWKGEHYEVPVTVTDGHREVPCTACGVSLRFAYHMAQSSDTSVPSAVREVAKKQAEERLNREFLAMPARGLPICSHCATERAPVPRR